MVDLVNIGTPNGNDGDTARDAFAKINAAHAELAARLQQIEAYYPAKGAPYVPQASTLIQYAAAADWTQATLKAQSAYSVAAASTIRALVRLSASRVAVLYSSSCIVADIEATAGTVTWSNVVTLAQPVSYDVLSDTVLRVYAYSSNNMTYHDVTWQSVGVITATTTTSIAAISNDAPSPLGIPLPVIAANATVSYAPVVHSSSNTLRLWQLPRAQAPSVSNTRVFAPGSTTNYGGLPVLVQQLSETYSVAATVRCQPGTTNRVDKALALLRHTARGIGLVDEIALPGSDNNTASDVCAIVPLNANLFAVHYDYGVAAGRYTALISHDGSNLSVVDYDNTGVWGDEWTRYYSSDVAVADCVLPFSAGAAYVLDRRNAAGTRPAGETDFGRLHFRRLNFDPHAAAGSKLVDGGDRFTVTFANGLANLSSRTTAGTFRNFCVAKLGPDRVVVVGETAFSSAPTSRIVLEVHDLS